MGKKASPKHPVLFTGNDPTMHPLVLLRHGQSTWNLENRFTGWTDVDLTGEGRQEAHTAARLLIKAGFTFDIAFTSVLKRSIDTLWIVMEDMNLQGIPVEYAWQLNERHYGALQGQNKADTAQELGQELVMGWRRGYQPRPPPMEPDDPRHPRFDPRYAHLSPEELPGTESLQDTLARLLPYWQGVIVPTMRSGKRVLIVAHGNSLRALVKYLDDVPEADVPEIHIPTGIPLVYELDIDFLPIRHYYINAS